MDLEKAAGQLRPRSAYEAVDFGFVFVRDHYWRLVGTMMLFVFPVASVLAIAFPRQIAWLSLLMWWTKPVGERALIFSLSRAFFGDRLPIRDTMRAFRQYERRDWLLALTLRRLSPTRSFDLPVTVLEGSKGRERADRLGILHRGRLPAAAIMLTFVLAHVEVALTFGIVILVGMLTPETLDWSIFSWLFDLEHGASLGGQLFLYYQGLLAMCLVAPFYVVGGFSLYLHRRTELEAWDLELAFRRLGERVASSRRGQSSTTAVTIVALTVLCGLTLRAGPGLAVDVTPESARETIQTILEGEAFHQLETIRIPRWLLDWELEGEADEPTPFRDWLTSFADGLSSLIGGGLEIFFVTCGLGALAWLVFRVARQRGLFELGVPPPRRRPAAPVELFGLEVTERSLPENLVAVAREEARAGRTRAALALLYRGALTRLSVVYGAELARGVTERECVEVARDHLPAEGTRYLESLTSTWLRCAYGHYEPDVAGVESLCEGWSSWFVLPPSADPEERRDVG
jgi:hypothetical protein